MIKTRRMTKQRRIILEELDRHKTHPTADELYRMVRLRLSRISLGTVYRNLQVLAREGVIRTLDDGRRMRFDSVLQEHYHIRCLSCGRVGDLPAGAVPRIDPECSRASGFKLIGFKVDFVGICMDCQRQGKEVSIADDNTGDYKILFPA